jgi:hypothetical protein
MMSPKLPPDLRVARVAQEVSKHLANDGKLIEAGWVIMQTMIMPPDASQAQIDDMRMAYMAGAQHLFSSMISIMDPGEEPTDADLNRMDLIHRELEAWRKEMELRTQRAEGRA